MMDFICSSGEHRHISSFIENDYPDFGELSVASPKTSTSLFEYASPIVSKSSFPYSVSSSLYPTQAKKGSEVSWVISVADDPPSTPDKAILNKALKFRRSAYDGIAKVFRDRPICLKSYVRFKLPQINENDLKMYWPNCALLLTR